MATMTPLAPAEILALLERNLPRVDHRGESIDEIGDNVLRMRLPVRHDDLSFDLPAGSGQTVLSAPVMMGFADTAMYACVHAFYGASVFAALVNFNVSFLRVAGAGDLVAVARLVRKGRHLAFLETHLFSGLAPEPCSHVTATYMVSGASRSVR